MEELPVERVGEDDAVVRGRLRPRARPEEGVRAGAVVRKVLYLDPPLAERVDLRWEAEFSNSNILATSVATRDSKYLVAD